jgi:hypothetical protein
MLALFTVPFTPATATIAALDPEHIDSPDRVGEDVGDRAADSRDISGNESWRFRNYCKRTKISGYPAPDIRCLNLDQSRLRARCTIDAPLWRRRDEGMTMLTHHVTGASVLAVLLLAISGPQAAKAKGGPLAACKADAEKICPGVAPGGGKLIQYLRQDQDDVTIGCAKELKAIKTKMGK